MNGAIIPSENTEKQHRPFVEPEVGKWYWVKEEAKSNYAMQGCPHPEYSWFAVVYNIGSNYVEFRSPSLRGGEHYDRIHFNDLEDKVIFEEDPKKVIEMNCKFYGKKVQKILDDVTEVCKTLGLTVQELPQASAGDNAIIPTSCTLDAKQYKTALIKAKEETLPEHFKEIEHNQEHLKRCMAHETMGMMGLVKSLEKATKTINKRIFNVTLYAGITEEIVTVKEGQPGKIDDKVHLMQRRLYMDEECLLNYRHGGMEFKDIDDFDKWLAEDENFYRCLPFEKCIVTFRVRREKKARYARDIYESYINMFKEKQDRLTYMYIRNGEQLYRLSTDMNFGEMIFPNIKDFDPQSPKMVDGEPSRDSDIISVKDWEYLRNEEKEELKKRDQWWIDNPLEKWCKDNHREVEDSKYFYQNSNPYRERYRYSYLGENWKPLDKNNIYYDEAIALINEKMDEYNRIALIVQGFLDRTEILNPLPQVNLKDKQDFQDRVKLVYDGDMVLYNGEKPSVESYIMECNASINKDSVFIGQVDYWERKQAEKENNKRINSMSDLSCTLTRYRPMGNPGPRFISKGAKFHPRSKHVTFEWERQITNYSNPNYGSLTVTRVKVPFNKLFNVSAYKLGDYKQFFQDPRTREEYLTWAPMLLAAEEYHAGTWNEDKIYERKFHSIMCW